MARLISSVLLLLAMTAAAKACSLCGLTNFNKSTLGQEMDQAGVVLFGRVVDSRISVDVRLAPGSGTSDFVIDAVVKGESAVQLPSQLTIDGYLPVLSPKEPPLYLMFGQAENKQLKPQGGRSAASAAVVDYLRQAQPVRSKGDRVAALVFYARFLDSADPIVAQDAYLEFARSKDSEVGEAAQRLSPETFRKLMDDPAIPSERLGLFAFLLAGNKDQAAFLAGLVDHPSERFQNVLEGILSGYMTAAPTEGWNRCTALLGDPKQKYKVRYKALQAARFHYNWKPAECRAQVLRAYAGVLSDGDLADVVVEDMRRWQMWDLADHIYPLYTRPSHASPIMRRSIIRYALVARQNPAAKGPADQFLNGLSTHDQEDVRDLAEQLSLER